MTADARLARLCDLLVPAARGMPCYTQADPGFALFARTRTLLPGRWGLASTLVETLPPMPSIADVERCERAQPEAFEALLEIVLGAYTLSRHVRARLGYDGQQALTLPRDGFGVEEEALAMMASPPRWRDPRITKGEA